MPVWFLCVLHGDQAEETIAASVPRERQMTMSALSDLVKYAQMGEVVYMRGDTIREYSRAKEAAAELAALRARVTVLEELNEQRQELIGAAERRYGTLERERDALWEAFQRYAYHIPTCPNKFSRDCGCEFNQDTRALDALKEGGQS